ncbi:hypothetical protein ACHAWF_015941 [Thalassiosira exigua]
MTILVKKADHEELLCRCIPRSIVRRLHRGETVVERYNDATMCFIDIVSFTSMSGRMEAHEVMEMLEVLFREFDKLAVKHNCFNAETIGDAYLTISGGPGGEDGPTGAANIAAFSLGAVDAVEKLEFQGGKKIMIRCGFATGPIVAGAIGTGGLPKYTVFGDTVNFSSRMESTSRAMMIQCPHKSYKLLRESSEFDFQLEEREEEGEVGIFVKGKGQTLTFWVKGFTSAGRDVETSGDLVGTRDVAALGTDLVLDVETLCLGSDGKDKSVSFQVGACVQEK